MNIVKKLSFAPLFILSFVYFCYLLPDFIQNSAAVLSLSFEAFWSFILITILTLVIGFFYAVFVTLSQDWKLVLPVILLASIIPFAFLAVNLSLYLGVGTLISLLIIFAILDNKLKTYLTFQPSVLLSSPIRNFATMLILILSITYFISLNSSIQKNGVVIPDSLFSSLTNITQSETQLSPSDQLVAQAQAKKEFAALIKPYQNLVAPGLALLVFLSLISTISLIGLFLPVLLWLTFLILKSTGFIKFQTEMREVKKLVV